MCIRDRNESGEIVETSQTAPDGYFTFEQIPPGNYTVRADPEDELNLPPQFVSLTPDNLFRFGTDMIAQLDPEIAQAVSPPVFGEPVWNAPAPVPAPMLDKPITADGLLNADKIISLARNLKGKQVGSFLKTSSSHNNAANLFNAVQQSKQSAFSPQANIRSIRLGQHPNKERVVMDLSGPLAYTISRDVQNGLVTIDMPTASSSAPSRWSASKAGLVNHYRTETLEQGVRLILSVQNGARVGASGLLKPYAGKPQRLYIDIES